MKFRHTVEMLRTMFRQARCQAPCQDIVITRLENNNKNTRSKRHKMFVNPVWCNFTYVWGLPSQKGNSLL